MKEAENMTTTELIKLLQENERGGASGRPREISLTIPGFGLLAGADFAIDSTGDGMFSEICLEVKARAFYPEEQEEEE